MKDYLYGTISNHNGKTTKARMEKETGDIEFLLWAKGCDDRDCDFYHKVGAGWELTFVSADGVLFA